MQFKRKPGLLLIVLLLGFCLLTGGCTTAKKPLTTPTPQANKSPQITTPTNNTQQMAKRVAAEASKVEGVKGATAVISVKNIYIGLDLNANLEKNKVAAVEKTVLDRIKNMEPGYKVMVSSDIDTVTRIKKVAQGTAQGKPLSSFTKEIEDINSRMTPRTQ